MDNPLKYVDPLGLDYIFVGGQGQDWWDQWWIDMLMAFDWDPAEERVSFIQDPNPGLPFEVGDQYSALVDTLVNDPYGGYTDIKIIGFSEGAAAMAMLLDNIARDEDFLSGVRDEIKAAILLECISGTSAEFIKDYDDTVLYGLPRKLVEAELDIVVAEIWNRASIVHTSGPSPGWTTDTNSFSYDSRGWRAKIIQNIMIYGDIDRGLKTGSSYHSDVLTCDYTIKTIKSLLP